jgi:uncharacterized protein Yka (UPF0111/DUF47 family)
VEVGVRKRWFLPRVPDVLGTLIAQCKVTEAGIDAFCEWSNGDPAHASAVRAREHEADEVKRQVLREIREAYITPLSPEDLFELSERLDEVLNAAKDIVRETELLAMAPDAPMAQMAADARIGVHELLAAFSYLTKEPDQATAAADRAIHQQRAIEHIYRRAMSGLLEKEDLHEVTGRRELYRRYARMGDAIEAVANRVWYAVVKQA